VFGRRKVPAAHDGERIRRGATMAKKVRPKHIKAPRTAVTKPAKRKDKSWEQQLRLVGDARFTEVAWSGRDHPSWPLPRK
jgi:hypothetical protein